MNPDDQVFSALLRAIWDDPNDQLVRGVLADRLHELGEYELENWWRGGAENWMRDFASKCAYEWDDEGNPAGTRLTYEQVLAEADDWVLAVKRDGEDEWGGLWCRFSQYQCTTASGLMEDPENASTFWRAYETIRGKLVDDDAKGHGGNMFGCTC